MAENRDRRRDLTALALLALTALLGLSLISYHRNDPIGDPVFPLNRFYQPDTLAFPPSNTIQNLCGHTGAVVADLLLTALGWGAYYLVGSLAVVAMVLLVRGTIASPFLRLVGWCLTLIGLTALTTMLAPERWSGPMIGPGGYLGALSYGLLQQHFAAVGGFLLAFSAVVFGLILCTDYILFQLAVFLIWAIVQRIPMRYMVPRASAGSASKTPPMSIRIGKRQVSCSVDESAEDQDGPEDLGDYLDEEEEEDEDEEWEEDDEWDEEEEAEEEADDEAGVGAKSGEGSNGRSAKGLRGLMSRTPPALRLRKPPETAERQEVIAQLEEASRHEERRDYDLPSIDLLQPGDDFCYDEQEKEVRRKAKILEKTFRDFGFQVKVVEVETGPVIAQYEIELEAGLRLSKITSLADDLAIALRVPSVRIVAPIPGKNTVGIEVPNEQRQVVRLREVMDETNGRIKKMRIPLFLGKDVSGSPLTVDLSTLPHLLIAGRTGTGKSVCLNAIISSILMTRRPDEVRLLMIDPKMVELSCYKTLPHLMHPVVTDMRKAEAILAWAVDKMEERYGLLARAGVRHVSVYNQLSEEELIERLQPESEEEQASIPRHLPYIVIVADELADLMMTSGKEVEQHIIRLAQKSRAVGIHLILATQKPTVDVITGLIKSNLPARIAFQVASRTDSRVVLDEMGAERLLGNGDMLFLWPGTSTLLRGQGTYLSDEEINKVVECVSTGEQDFVTELVQLKVDAPGEAGNAQISQRDELYESAVEIVIREGRGSVSLLQRCLGIGYGRAARLIDYMAEDGVVGPYNGSQAREVVMTLAQWQQLLAGNAEPSPASAAPKPTTAPAHRVIGLHDQTPRKPPRAAEEQSLPWETEDEEPDEEEYDDEYDDESDEEYDEEYEDDELGEEEEEPTDDEEDGEEDEYEYEYDEEDEDDGEEEEEEDVDPDDEEDQYEDEEVDEYEGPDYEPEQYEYDAQAADGDADDSLGEEPGEYDTEEPFDPEKHGAGRR